MRQALQRMHRLLPIGRKLGGAGEQPLLLVDFERGDGGGASSGVARIGVAVEEIDRLLRAAHEGVVDLALDEHGAHRNGAVGDALGRGDDVRRDAEIIGAERRAEAAEGGDDLIEDEQDVVLGADRGEALEIALWRDQHAGGARHRLDDHRGDGRGVVQRDEALQIVGKLGAMLRLAAAEGVAARCRGCGGGGRRRKEACRTICGCW